MNGIPQFVFLSGNIGVGKSTIMNALRVLLHDKNTMFIKEYIDYSPVIGTKCLEMNKRGELSDVDFQNFILDCYECQFAKISSEEIVVVERHPYEAIDVFCELSEMSFQDKGIIRDRIQNLLGKYCIPSPYDCKFYKFNTSLFKTKAITDDICGKMIEEFALKRTDGIICELFCFVQDAMKRIESRGRDCEKDITAHFWCDIQDKYEIFFKKYK